MRVTNSYLAISFHRNIHEVGNKCFFIHQVEYDYGRAVYQLFFHNVRYQCIGYLMPEFAMKINSIQGEPLGVHERLIGIHLGEGARLETKFPNIL